MKKLTLILLLLITISSQAQTSVLKLYRTADSLLQSSKPAAAYNILKDIALTCDKEDTLYRYILWNYVAAASRAELQFRLKAKFDSSLSYGLEALSLIEKSAPYFDSTFIVRNYWMYKNVVVSSYGLGKFDQAKKYQDLLYKAWKDKKLPEGLDQYYNFTFFKWNGKNIWGYEWYPEAGDPGAQGSYSKIVYYVYNTNTDGTDKEQLYQLHVAKIQKADNAAKFDYVLTKKLEAAKNEVSGTFYAYTYNKKIDYAKLQADIKEVLKENYYPDTRATANRN